MSHEESSLRACDFCSQQMHCRNIYVALRILEEELRFVADPRLKEEFNSLKTEAEVAGFAFPSGKTFCEIAANDKQSLDLVTRARSLLGRLRQTLRLVEA